MRTIAMVLATSALLGPVPARAQDSSTTCNAVGNYLNCDTRTHEGSGGAVSGFAKGFNESLERQGGLASIMERRRDRRSERARQDRYAKAGKLIDLGKCPEARSFTLTSGDLDLAQRVAALCPVPPAQ